MPTVQKDAKRMALLEEFYKEKVSWKALREERFLAMAEKAPFDFSWVDAPMKGKLEAVEEPHGNANFEFLLGFLASFAKELPTQKAVLMKLSENYPLVKKAEEKMMRQAWAEEETKVQRSMVSYVLLRARKSENTRKNLPNLEILKEMVSIVDSALVDSILFLGLEARKKDKEAEEEEDAGVGSEGQEDVEEEEAMESDAEEELEVEETEVAKEPEAEKEEDAKSEKGSNQAKESKDPEKESVKEEVPKSENNSRAAEEIEDPKKESVKEEVPKPKNNPRGAEESTDPEKESVKVEVPKSENDSRTTEEGKDPDPEEKVKASGSKDPQTDGTKESLECFKKEAEQEAKKGALDEADKVQKGNGVFEAAAFLATLNMEAQKIGLAGPDAANIIKAQQATRAMLRRANNNHEPEGLPEDPEASADEDKDPARAKQKGRGKGKPKGKAKAKAKAKGKSKAKAKPKAKARVDSSSDKEEDSEESCEKDKKPKKRGRTHEKSRREESPEVPAKNSKAKTEKKARPGSSKPARKREPSRSPNPESMWDSASETEPLKNKKLKPLKRSKSEERAMRSTSEDEDEKKAPTADEGDEDEEEEDEDPSIPTIYPTVSPRGTGKLLSEDQRRQKIQLMTILKKHEKQFILPPESILNKGSSFTLRPPKAGTHEDHNECSKIQVIIAGQFYVKGVDEDLLAEVNSLYDTGYKVQARPHVGGMDSSELKPKAAMTTDELWKHANLGKLRSFLRAQVKDGSRIQVRADGNPNQGLKHRGNSPRTESRGEGEKQKELTKKEQKKAEELRKRKLIKRMGEKAKNNSEMNSILFEAWEKCNGDWKTSSIYLNLKNIKSTRRTGVRVWMTRAEVVAKFGETSADAIILRKLGDEKLKNSEVRRHPELPESDELVQYLILDTSKFVEQEEEIMEQLYSAAEVDSSSSESSDSSASTKKAKKDKAVDEVLEELKKKQEEDKKLVINKAGKKIQDLKTAEEDCANLGTNVREAAEKDLKESADSLKANRGNLQDAVDKKVGFFQAIFTATMSLSRTWNFPDTIIKKSLLHLLKFEDKIKLKEEVGDSDKDVWSTTNALRLSAAFRASKSNQSAIRPESSEEEPEDMQNDDDKEDDNEQNDAEQEDEQKEAAQSAVANDFFLSALDNMLAGEDPAASTSFSYASPTPGPPRRAPAIRMRTPGEIAENEKKDAENEKKDAENEKKDAENEKSQPTTKQNKGTENEKEQPKTKQKKDTENEKEQPKTKQKKDAAENEKEQPKTKKPKKDAENEKEQPQPQTKKPKKDVENEPQVKDAEDKKEDPATKNTENEKKQTKPKKQNKDRENEKEQPHTKKPKKDTENEKEQPQTKKQKKDPENDKGQPNTKKQKKGPEKEQPTEDAEDAENDTEQPQKNKPEKKTKPIQDMDLGVVRVRYTTQGSKNPIVKLEVREDRFRPTSPWVQRLQVVIRNDGGFTVQQGFNVLKTFALCYFQMNLNPGEINFKLCKSSLLEHALEIGHDWAMHLSWKYINKLKLKGFPEAPLAPDDKEKEEEGENNKDRDSENDENEEDEEEEDENEDLDNEGSLFSRDVQNFTRLNLMVLFL
ncbi:unnamed protein product [Symbiodinium sp. CCMP2592]|nr:unnamed protein product [Symbiodinium sp. CCMP2592]